MSISGLSPINEGLVGDVVWVPSSAARPVETEEAKNPGGHGVVWGRNGACGRVAHTRGKWVGPGGPTGTDFGMHQGLDDGVSVEIWALSAGGEFAAVQVQLTGCESESLDRQVSLKDWPFGPVALLPGTSQGWKSDF